MSGFPVFYSTLPVREWPPHALNNRLFIQEMYIDVASARRRDTEKAPSLAALSLCDHDGLQLVQKLPQNNNPLNKACRPPLFSIIHRPIRPKTPSSSRQRSPSLNTNARQKHATKYPGNLHVEKERCLQSNSNRWQGWPIVVSTFQRPRGNETDSDFDSDSCAL